jgi:hypothetical protein
MTDVVLTLSAKTIRKRKLELVVETARQVWS